MKKKIASVKTHPRKPVRFSPNRRMAGGKAPFFIQMKGGGGGSGLSCLELLNAPTLNIIGGIAAHGAITVDFNGRVAGALSISIPGGSATPQRTEGRPGTPDQINPQTVGGRAGTGFPDLARMNGTVLEVAEIKPAFWPLMVEGEFQLGRYVEQGNATDLVAQQWRTTHGISRVVPMPMNSYTPPSPIMVGTVPIIVQWCHPGLLVYKSVELPFVPKPVEKPRRVGDKVRDWFQLPEFPSLTPEQVGATVTAAGMGALLAYALKKGLMKTPAGRAAAVAAIAILLASGKAEASISLEGGKDPLEAFFEAMEQDGVAVPDELKEVIQNDPELKRMVEEAAKKGSLSEAQKELAGQQSQLINDNLDQFSEEELQMLITSSEVVNEHSQDGIPATTVEQLKAQLNKKGGEGTKEGSEGNNNGSDEGQAAPSSDNETPLPTSLNETTKKMYTNASPAVQELYRALVNKSNLGPQSTDSAVQTFFNLIPPDLTEKEKTFLMSRLADAEGLTIEQLIADMEKALKSLRSAEETEEGASGTDEGSAASQSDISEEAGISEEEFARQMMVRIEKFDWSDVKGYFMRFPKEYSKKRPPLHTEFDVLLFELFLQQTPDGEQILKSTANLRVKVIERDTDTKTEKIEFVSSSKVVLETGKVESPKQKGLVYDGTYK